MRTLEAELARATAAGHQFHRDDHFADAAESFARALSAVDTLVLQGQEGLAERRIELLVALASVLFDLDRWGEAEQKLGDALQALDSLPDGMRPAPIRAVLFYELGRVHWQARRPGEAINILRSALALLPRGSEHEATLLRARMQAVLGVVLALSGEVDESIDLLDAALAVFEHPAHWQFSRDHARLLSNIGYAQCVLGRLVESQQTFRRALAMFEGMVQAGRWRQRVDIARTLMNLGSVLSNAGAFSEATQCQRAALTEYTQLIRRARRQRSDTSKLRTSHAMTEMNIGYTLFKAGDHATATRHLRHALRNLAPLAEAHPYLGDDLARVVVNQAHVAAQTGSLRQAATLYLRGHTTFQSLIAEGRVYLRAEDANALLGVARVRMAQGRLAEASQQSETALSTLVELTQRGQLQHAPAWSRGWREHCSAWLARDLAQRNPASTTPARKSASERPEALQAALRMLAQAPLHALSAGPEPLRDFFECLDQLTSWQAAAASAQTPIIWCATLIWHYLSHLFDRAADLLGDSDPGWLHQHAPRMAELVARLRELALAQPDGSRLLADWFFHTRGLRAQRSALAEGADPQTVALRDLLDQLRRTEEEMLAEHRGPSPNADAGARAVASLAGAAGALAATLAEQRAAHWLDLHHRSGTLRSQLVQAGLLPETLRLKAGDLSARMADHSALVMLARASETTLLVIALHRPDALGACFSHAVVALRSDLARFPCTLLNRMARHAVGGAARGLGLRGSADGPVQPPIDLWAPSPQDFEAFAIEAFQSLADTTALPVLRSLAERGFTDVSLVPSDDLHLVPWGHVLTPQLPAQCTLTVYPNSGAWARLRMIDGRASIEPPLWAVAAHAAADSLRPLPWVEIELRLSERLWHGTSPRMQRLDARQPQAEGVNALMGMGHGSAPGQNLARAGLMLSADRVLSAHDLPAIRTCRRALLSCCVLGQTDDAFGEALGFLSTSFGYHTEFGAGWLTEVPDAEACLFSLAFQFALAQAYRCDSPASVSWGQVFRRTRQTVIDGCWPDAFGEWLALNLPSVVDERGMPGLVDVKQWPALRGGTVWRAPPSSLQKLMPWAVALGR